MHGITLTPTGRSILRLAGALLRQATDLEAEARDDADELSGALAVGCYLTIAPTVIRALRPRRSTRDRPGRALPYAAPRAPNGVTTDGQISRDCPSRAGIEPRVREALPGGEGKRTQKRAPPAARGSKPTVP